MPEGFAGSGSRGAPYGGLPPIHSGGLGLHPQPVPAGWGETFRAMVSNVATLLESH